MRGASGLALVRDEAGADVVARAAGSDDATIPAFNHTETLQKALDPA